MWFHIVEYATQYEKYNLIEYVNLPFNLSVNWMYVNNRNHFSNMQKLYHRTNKLQEFL